MLLSVKASFQCEVYSVRWKLCIPSIADCHVLRYIEGLVAPQWFDKVLTFSKNHWLLFIWTFISKQLNRKRERK